MSIFRAALLVMSALACGTGLVIGAIELAARRWERAAAASIVRGAEAMIRAQSGVRQQVPPAPPCEEDR